MIKIGLTGSIASGKSTVSKIISELDIPIIDCDIIARQVLEMYPIILTHIQTRFGKEFIEHGELLRKKFGNYIFTHSDKKKEYEDIILPYIRIEIFQQITKYENEGHKLCIIDAPTLIETKLYKTMDANILVDVDLKTQIERVMNRDNFTKEQALDRINSQMLSQEKAKYVDYIINNNSTIEILKEQIYIIIINCFKNSKNY
jgi:dephospho-CoA kinase